MVKKWLLIFSLFITLILSSCSYSTYESIKQGGEWFLNNQNEDFLYYEYDNGSYSNQTHTLRELGALWSITQLAEYLDDQRYDILAQKGLHHFEKYLVYDPDKDIMYLNISPPSLGYNAFLILALINENETFYLEKLAKGILSLQNPDGSFRTFFFLNSTSNQDYYPGEALVALMTLYEQTGNQVYLQSVKRAFPHYYYTYWRENPNPSMIPWHTRANYKLYQATQDRNVADFIFEMNNGLVLSFGQGTCNFAFTGREGVFVEGMNYALALAEELGEPTRCYRTFVREATKAMKKNQIQSDDVTNGAFPHDTIRVDHNQHAVMALMEAKELGNI